MTAWGIGPVAVTVIVVLTSLAGCSGSHTAEPAAPSLEPVEVACLSVSVGALESLNRHMLHGTTVVEAAAVLVAPDDDGSPEWFVAGSLAGPGMEGATAIWHTRFDPTAEGENAYLSVDAMAAEFSDYVKPEASHGQILNASEAVTCLE